MYSWFATPVKREPVSETDPLPTHSKYIQNVLARKAFHDPSFRVYQDTDDSFKIGRSGFKYNDKHTFVDGKKYKATQGLWELLTQDKQAYKEILLQSNAGRVNYNPSGKIKENKSLKYKRFSQLFTNTKDVPCESFNY